MEIHYMLLPLLFLWLNFSIRKKVKKPTDDKDKKKKRVLQILKHEVTDSHVKNNFNGRGERRHILGRDMATVSTDHFSSKQSKKRK